MRDSTDLSPHAAGGFALVYCLAMTLLGFKGIVLLTAVVLGCIGLFVMTRYSNFVLGMLIALIGLSPFFFSVRAIPGLPKLYGDDGVLLYLVYMVMAYMFMENKRFRLGDPKVLFTMVVFLAAAAMSFMLEPVAEAAGRNFAETFVLGFLFYFVFLNETTEDNADLFFRFIAATTVCITAYLYCEVAFQTNPIITKLAKHFLEEFKYLDPEMHRVTGAFYRPYAMFFHPSEAGTFIAMGLPFVFYSVRKSPPLLGYGLVLFVLGGIVVNYTRGVWIALAMSFFLCNFKMFRRYAPILAVTGALALVTVYFAMEDTPFGRRIFDPTNLYNRLFYWKIGLNMFVEHFPFGCGHMNFENNYLDFVHTATPPPGLDIHQLFVADNVILTTMVEQGLLGVTALIGLYAAIVSRVISARRQAVPKDPASGLRQQVIIHALLIYFFAGLLADVQLFAKASKLFFIVAGMGFALSRTSGEAT